MTLSILHKGIQANYAMDQTGFTGDIETDVALAVVTKMVSGRVVALEEDGLTLADGALHKTLGFLINDAAGYFYENKPALASGKLAVSMGNQVVITDQIDTSLVYSKGQTVYVGTGGSIGLLTNIAPIGGAAATLDFGAWVLITLSFEGLFGNSYSLVLVDGTGEGVVKGSEVVTRVGNAITVSIEDGVTDQDDVSAALLTLDEIITAVVDTGAAAVSAAGVSFFSGGSDGSNSFGICNSDASVSSPELEVTIV